MEKSYRDLFQSLEERTRGEEAFEALIRSIGEVDDTDPLRVHAMKAMKRNPSPPLNLVYEYQNSTLTLYARNTARKRKAVQPALCVSIAAPAWLFDVREAFPGHGQTRSDFLELVHRSFGYLELRIANYFTVGHDVALTLPRGPSGVLVLLRNPSDAGSSDVA